MQTQVKICGITSIDDGLCAAREGASFLGYIFYPPSKRFVAPRSALEVTRAVRTEFPDVQHVGVFVDDEAANIAWTAALAGLDLVQLHGRETPDFCAELDLLGLRTIKTVGIGAEGTTVNPAVYRSEFFLCDTHDEALKGGTGRRFDLTGIPAGLDHSRLFLAGGLTAENVGDLLAQIRPYAVDVSSGVEIRPGVKSHRAIKDFLQAVSAATASCNDDSNNTHFKDQETSASNVIQ